AQHSGTIIVRGLAEPVEVLRDTWGVPHIYAKSTEDLFFAQGFVVAQDRMWQLEMWRRNGEGRLAEVLGPQYVTRDKFARLLAFPPGLDLNDISPAILDVTRGANDLQWTLTSSQSASTALDQIKSELGSNNWVVDAAKSTTGRPILANDPHREVVNPALRYVVHLNAPGWNALGAT